MIADDVQRAIEWAALDSAEHQSQRLTWYLGRVSIRIEAGETMEVAAGAALRDVLGSLAGRVDKTDPEYWMQFLAGYRRLYPDRRKHWWWWVILPNAK